MRLLNLENEARCGSFDFEHEGRNVTIRAIDIKFNPDRFTVQLSNLDFRAKAAQLEEKYSGKTLLDAIDDLYVLKEIALKLIAFEEYLKFTTEPMQSIMALVQVAICRITTP